MARPRSTYTPEFKLRAVRLTTDQKPSVAEAAGRRDVGENLHRVWKKAFLARGGAAFPGHGNPTPALTSGGGSGPSTPGRGPSPAG